MIIFVYNPFERSKQIFQDINRVEEREDKSFRIYKKDGFYKDFPRLCIWWEVKITTNPNDPCEDCLFNYSKFPSCEDVDNFKFTLSDSSVVCSMHHQK